MQELLHEIFRIGDLAKIKKLANEIEINDNRQWFTHPNAFDNIMRSENPEWIAWHKSFLVNQGADDTLPLVRMLIAIDMYQNISWVREMLGYYPEIARNMLDPEHHIHHQVLGFVLGTWNWEFVLEMLPYLKRDAQRLVIDDRCLEYWERKTIGNYERRNYTAWSSLSDDSPYLSLDNSPHFEISWTDYSCHMFIYPRRHLMQFLSKVACHHPDILMHYLLRAICSSIYGTTHHECCESSDNMVQFCRDIYPDLTLTDLLQPDNDWFRCQEELKCEKAGNINVAWKFILSKLFPDVTIYCGHQWLVIVGYYEDLPGFQSVEYGVLSKDMGRTQEEDEEWVVKCAIELHMSLHSRVKSARK